MRHETAKIISEDAFTASSPFIILEPPSAAYSAIYSLRDFNIKRDPGPGSCLGRGDLNLLQ